MNSLTWIFVIGCTVILFTAQRAEGIRCYTCIGGGCEDDFKADGVMVEETCKGSCTKVKLGGLYTRSCNILKFDDDCQEEDEAAICHCNTNLCNGSSTVMASTIVMAAFTAVALMFKKF